MGCVKTIDFDKFPEQYDYVGQRVKVCFFYNTDRLLGGIVVRDDKEEPWRTIIKLDDGRYIMADECQYSHVDTEKSARTPPGNPGPDSFAIDSL